MTDSLIIGGGVVGLSIAYELACHGLRVRVLDRGPLGREASWAGAGILPAANRRTAVDPYDRLRGWSSELHATWAERLRAETGLDTGYRRCGGWYLARTSGEAASLRAWKVDLEEEEVRCESVALGDLLEREPGLAEPAAGGLLRACCFLPDEAQLRNPWHLRALAEACLGRGVELSPDCECRELEAAPGRLISIRTERERIEAAAYCFASGAWTQLLLRQLHLATGILPIRGQMVLFRCPQPPIRSIVNEGSRYVVPRDDGLVLAGSTEEAVGFDKSNTAEGVAELAQFARDLVPALRTATIERTWAGLRPGSLDGFPYLGRVASHSNVFVAAGHFRSGLFLSPATATVLGQLMRGEQPEIDLSPFAPGRGVAACRSV